MHRNLSQEALAHLAGLDRQTVSNIERAVYGTSVDNAFSLAWALRVPPEVLFGEQPLDTLAD